MDDGVAHLPLRIACPNSTPIPSLPNQSKTAEWCGGGCAILQLTKEVIERCLVFRVCRLVRGGFRFSCCLEPVLATVPHDMMAWMLVIVLHRSKVILRVCRTLNAPPSASIVLAARWSNLYPLRVVADFHFFIYEHISMSTTERRLTRSQPPLYQTHFPNYR